MKFGLSYKGQNNIRFLTNENPNKEKNLDSPLNRIKRISSSISLSTREEALLSTTLPLLSKFFPTSVIRKRE